MYNSLVRQFLAYCKRHSDEKFDDKYEHFYYFLTYLLGMDKSEAEHEVALFMNKVCDLMDK
jgi:hypothetical protein